MIQPIKTDSVSAATVIPPPANAAISMAITKKIATPAQRDRSIRRATVMNATVPASCQLSGSEASGFELPVSALKS